MIGKSLVRNLEIDWKNKSALQRSDYLQLSFVRAFLQRTNFRLCEPFLKKNLQNTIKSGEAIL